MGHEPGSSPPPSGAGLEWIVALAGKLGFSRVWARWRLLALTRRWSNFLKDAAPATSRRFRHQKCWSCAQIRHIDETRCGACGARLGSKYVAFMRALGFVVPPTLAVSSLLVALNVAIYVRLWLLEGGASWELSLANLEVHGAHGAHSYADPQQWWRIAAAMFLHFSVLHLGMNMLALMQIGPSLEDLLGRGEMLLVYLLTGLAGNLVSELRPTTFIGAGASGAIMGMVGLAAGLGHASGAIEGRAIRDRMLKWGAYTLVFGLVIGADNLAHAGGFIVGGLWGLARAKTATFRGQPPSHPALGMVGAVLLAGSALPPLLLRASADELATIRGSHASEPLPDLEELASCERELLPMLVVVWSWMSPEARAGRTVEQFVASVCEGIRQDARQADANRVAAAQKEYSVPGALPQTSVTLAALLEQLAANGEQEPAAAFEKWGLALGDRLRARSVINVPGARGTYQAVERKEGPQPTLTLVATTTSSAAPTSSAEDAVPRALRQLLAEHNVALPGVGDFLVRPCRSEEAAPCAAFVLGAALEDYAFGRLGRSALLDRLRAPPVRAAAPKGSRPLRGIKLVEAVIGHVRLRGLLPSARPVPAAVLATLTLPGSRPLPKTLRRWLEFDGTLLFKDPTKPEFHLLSAGDRWGESFPGYPEWQVLLDAMLPGDTILLPGGDVTRKLLYLGAYDLSGELPFVYFDADDVPTARIDGGFDVYIAGYFSLPDFALEPDATDQQTLQLGFENLGGRVVFSAW